MIKWNVYVIRRKWFILMRLSALVWGPSVYALQTALRRADGWTWNFPTANIVPIIWPHLWLFKISMFERQKNVRNNLRIMRADVRVRSLNESKSDRPRYLACWCGGKALLSTQCTSKESICIPEKGKRLVFSLIGPYSLWALPCFYWNGYRWSFHEGRGTGWWNWPLTPSRDKIKNMFRYTSISSYGFIFRIGKR